MQNSNNVSVIKEWDTKHRRMLEKTCTCLVDLLQAEYIRIDGDTRELTCRALGYEEYGIYEGDNNTGRELIGYIKPSVKKQIVISVSKGGILFQAFVKYSKIKCYVKP